VEQLLAAASHDFGFSLAVLRPSAVYGPGQDAGRGLGVVTTFLRSILAGEPLRIYGSLSSGRDYLHVDDLAECTAAVIGHVATGTFEVGGPEIVSLHELVRLLEETSGFRAELLLDDPTGFDAELVSLDNSAVTAATGWAPRRRLRDSLIELVDALTTSSSGRRMPGGLSAGLTSRWNKG
jgi:nucleoside-diphosphate-sugar epimerase